MIYTKHFKTEAEAHDFFEKNNDKYYFYASDFDHAVCYVENGVALDYRYRVIINI